MANAHSYILDNPSDFKAGQTVYVHPATDAFMRGEQVGDVVKTGRKFVSVRMFRSGRVLRFAPTLLSPDV